MASLQKLGYQVFSVLECPKGWHEEAALQEKFNKDHATGARLPRLDPADKDAFLWESLSGHPVSASAFTLIVPLHNEAKTLSAFMGALQRAVLPNSLPAQIVFVTNGCTDETVPRLREILLRVGPGRYEQIPGLGDVMSVSSGKASLMHVNNTAPGKATALETGNRAALRAGHSIALSIDADVWPEPHTFALFFGEVSARLAAAAGKPCLVSGTPRPVGMQDGMQRGIGRTGTFDPIRSWISLARSRVAVGAPGAVSGWLLGWDATVLQRLGGFPKCCMEDYGMGVKVRANGGELVRSKAKVWGRMPDTLTGRFRMTMRFIRGAGQLAELFAGSRAELEVMERDGKAPHSFHKRLSQALRTAAAVPLVMPATLARFAWRELARYALSSGGRPPGRETWERLRD